jgi:putative heme-binding domain-containing protein
LKNRSTLSIQGVDPMSVPPARRTRRTSLIFALAWLSLATTAGAAFDDPPPTPAESLKQFKVADDLELDQLLTEPQIAQPVFLNFDERGRMWVVEYRQYPEPAGLTMLGRDAVWRATYDKVSPPPPRQFRGLDRITIHEDTDGDGTFDAHKTFVDGLNIATACARGRGGVWVLNPPYLLFYPDKDNDDVPDGDPEVLLEGFGIEDTHSVVNSLCWGPDGWLYAAQGSTVTGRVRRPGTDDAPAHSLGQLLWRYHPETRRYEVFAEGGGNTFGVEIDAKGRAFSGHNGGDTRGFAYVQGGYFQKGFDKHGPLSNPFTFGYFPAMKHARTPRFTHTFVIYDGGAFPRHYDGKLFGVATLLNHVVLSEMIPEGSTVRTVDLGFPITTTDRAFRPVDIKLGPDGSLYIADWFDRHVSHLQNRDGKTDKLDGRVYRLKARGARPIARFDLSKKTAAELVALLAHPNQWFRRTALRLLGDRKDRSVVPLLAKGALEGKGQLALESLWALNFSGGLDEATALGLLDHDDPYVRLWTARLLCDPKEVSPAVASKLADRARVEPDVEARSQLACSARRLPASDSLPIVRNLLAHSEDLDDPHLPLLLWWAIEAKAASDRQAVLALFREPTFWSLPIVRRTIAERIMRRYAASGSRQDLLTCAELLRLAPAPDDRKKLLAGLEAATSGRSLAGLPDELAEALAKSEGGSTLLGVRRGRPEAVEEALRDLADPKADPTRRLQYARLFGEVDTLRSVPVLLDLARRSTDNALRAAALSSLQRYNDPAIGLGVLETLGGMTDDVRGEAFELLSSRVDWSLQLMGAIGAGQVDPRSVPIGVVRRLQARRDDRLAGLVRKHFADAGPAPSAEIRAEVDRLSGLVRNGLGEAKAGERTFMAKCAGCHALFGKGGNVGPDLTSYKRDDLDVMLLGVVNPSGEIREGYANYTLSTLDGRTLGGLLVDQDTRVVVLRNAEGRDVAIRREEIEELKTSPVSLMPEGLLKGMADRDVRDLFAYLRGTQPPK